MQVHKQHVSMEEMGLVAAQGTQLHPVPRLAPNPRVLGRWDERT